MNQNDMEGLREESEGIKDCVSWGGGGKSLSDMLYLLSLSFACRFPSTKDFFFTALYIGWLMSSFAN